MAALMPQLDEISASIGSLTASVRLLSDAAARAETERGQLIKTSIETLHDTRNLRMGLEALSTSIDRKIEAKVEPLRIEVTAIKVEVQSLREFKIRATAIASIAAAALVLIGKVMLTAIGKLWS